MYLNLMDGTYCCKCLGSPGFLFDALNNDSSKENSTNIGDVEAIKKRDI